MALVPFSALRQRLTRNAPVPVREMIGRVSHTYQSARRWLGAVFSVDKTVPDYEWWDKFRHGKQRGYEFSGLYAKRILNAIASYELGSGLSMTLDVNDDELDAPTVDPDDPEEETPRAYTDRLLDRFWKRTLPVLIRAEEDRMGLGDQYLIVNVDGTISVPSPETVTLEYDPLDYRALNKVTITVKLDKVTVTEEYTATERRVYVRKAGIPLSETTPTVYPNLIGRIPVVHWANDRGANEQHGHVLYEALLRVFTRYDDLLNKALDGVELLGNPIPAFTGVENVDAMLEANGVFDEEPYTDSQGLLTTRRVLALDKLPAVLLGKGADFKMVAPEKGFTTDIEKMLQWLFLLICAHTSTPEFMYGAGMNASRASIETQLPPFVQFIQARRLQLLGEGADETLGVGAKGGLYELADLWLRVRALSDPKIVVAPCKAQFPEITPEDAAVQLQKIIYAKGVNLIQNKTTLEQLRLVSDPDKEVRLAQAEAEAAAEEDYQTLLNQAAHQEVDPNANGQGKRSGITSGAPPDPDGGRNVRLKNGTPVGEMTQTKRKRKRRAHAQRTPAVP